LGEGAGEEENREDGGQECHDSRTNSPKKAVASIRDGGKNHSHDHEKCKHDIKTGHVSLL
ncbi:hypothetical protein COW83_04260, partial [Candidatus Collierbacteria bacterium CG22_combo_CG10-13_8_21_14_all_43_12]